MASAEYNNHVPYKWTILCCSELWTHPFHLYRTEKKADLVEKGQTVTWIHLQGIWESCCQESECSRWYYACWEGGVVKAPWWSGWKILFAQCAGLEVVSGELTGLARAVQVEKPSQSVNHICTSGNLLCPGLSTGGFPIEKSLWSCSASFRSGTKAILTQQCHYIWKMQHHPHWEVGHPLLEHQHMCTWRYPGLPLRQEVKQEIWAPVSITHLTGNLLGPRPIMTCGAPLVSHSKSLSWYIWDIRQGMGTTSFLPVG